MTTAATPAPDAYALDPEHPTQQQWQHCLRALHEWMLAKRLNPARTVVLVPYAQLMNEARVAWAQVHTSGFVPQFVTTRQWASSAQAFEPSSTDFSGDLARDTWVAQAWVQRTAQTPMVSGMSSVMASRLIESTQQLAALAAAVPPEHRADWGPQAQARWPALPPSLQWEAWVAQLALLWAGSSAYATDVLWGANMAPGVCADALVVLSGLQPDPLAGALRERWGDRATQLPLWAEVTAANPAQGHACEDAEDEAQRAAACVVRHLNAGRLPVALVANDRLLTRRVSALLQAQAVVLRDETGWMLSTTRSASALLGLLRAAAPLARMDEALDWLKSAPAYAPGQVRALEQRARRQRWGSAGSAMLAAPERWPEGTMALLQGLQAPRALDQWLQDLANALEACGLWSVFSHDSAGQSLLRALRLSPGAGKELQELAEVAAVVAGTQRRHQTLSLSAFTAWARDVLESTRFAPPRQADASVVVLPMAQLLGRTFAAAVVPGCDELNLNPSPEVPGQWTLAQREALGLPSRADLAQTALAAWRVVLSQPNLDVLWRTQDGGDVRLPSPWVLALGRQGLLPDAADPRVLWRGDLRVAPPPTPTAQGLLPETLSASAYQDLRDCPYRFFALRALRLSVPEELEAQPDARDWGNFLHRTLKAFHESRGDARPGKESDRDALERCAQATVDEMGLAQAAGFVPYWAVWPAVREGYLAWLPGHEVLATFDRAETRLTASAGPYTLVGELDRIDRVLSDGVMVDWVMDYKSERPEKTRQRVKNPFEDTQLAFYAALLPDGPLRAGYLSLSDGRTQGLEKATAMVEQEDIEAARDALLAGVQADLDRIEQGHALPALGEGAACEHCRARGLCRKDFWETPA
jgi:ATP-dependent helicase/nuclease subunit B